MALIEEHIKTGNWLFKYRSYLPVSLFVLYYVGLIQMDTSLELFQQYNWLIFCFCISLLGQFIRIISVGKVPIGTSGRNTKQQKAVSVNISGIYSIVRHPLYLGNYFMWLGMFLLIPIIWLQIVFSLIYWIYYERIMIAEEEFLRYKFGSYYTNWAARTPAFIPSFKRFVKNPLPYKYKNIIRREYTSLFEMIFLFLILIIINNGIVFGNWQINEGIKIALVITILFYFIMRLFKKKTNLLK